MARIRSVADYFDSGEQEKDLERLGDSIWSDSKGKIVDRDTFDSHFKDFMGDMTHKQQHTLAPAVFKKMKEKHESIDERRLFTKAGGKNLKQDQRTTAKTVLTNKEEFIRKGASKTDLKGLDTKQVRKRPRSEFTSVGHSGRRIVQIRPTFVTINGKRRTVYRASNGRFASNK